MIVLLSTINTMGYANETTRLKKDEFLRRIKNGEEKTIREWAEELFKEEDMTDPILLKRKVGTITYWVRNYRLEGEMLFTLAVGKRMVVYRVNDDRQKYLMVWRGMVDKAEQAIARASTVGESMVRRFPALGTVASETAKTLGRSARELSSFITIKV